MTSTQDSIESAQHQEVQAVDVPPLAAGGRLNRDVAWNLSSNVVSKAQSLSLLIGGYIIGRLSGTGVASMAMASCYLGAALADFGLASEMGRLSVTEPTKRTVQQCAKALLIQAPIAVILAPAIFYVTLGRRVGVTFSLLIVIGLLSVCLTATLGLSTILSGLLDFKTPAASLGITRLLSSVAAVIGAAIYRSPVAIIASFLAAEACSVAALTWRLARKSDGLPSVGDPTEHIRRARIWLGTSSVINILTNQSDTILVASILTPGAVGLFSIASQLQNGALTFGLAAAFPFAMRSVRVAVRGGSATELLRRATRAAAAVAAITAAVAWLTVQIGAGFVSKLSPLTTGRSALVIAICLISAIPSAVGGLYLTVTVGYGAHRSVGVTRLVTGLVATGCITGGALLYGVVGGAFGTLIRDTTLLVAGRRTMHSAAKAGRFRKVGLQRER